MSSKWTAQQVDGLITNVRADIKQFSSGGNTLDRENILDLISALDALRVECERLRAALTDVLTIDHSKRGCCEWHILNGKPWIPAPTDVLDAGPLTASE